MKISKMYWVAGEQLVPGEQYTVLKADYIAPQAAVLVGRIDDEVRRGFDEPKKTFFTTYEMSFLVKVGEEVEFTK